MSSIVEQLAVTKFGGLDNFQRGVAAVYNKSLDTDVSIGSMPIDESNDSGVDIDDMIRNVNTKLTRKNSGEILDENYGVMPVDTGVKKSSDVIANMLPNEIRERLTKTPERVPTPSEIKINRMAKNTNTKLFDDSYHETTITPPSNKNNILNEILNRLTILEKQNSADNSTPDKQLISLIFNGKNYDGRIKQNKSGQILFIVEGTNNCFILTPSNMKTFSKG
jgi:hypothetical protein